MTLQTVLTSYRTAAESVQRSMNVGRLGAWRMLLSTRIRHGIGPFYFCLFSLNGKPASNWPEYLTNYELEPVQRRWNPEHTHSLVRDKLQFHQRCDQANLPTPVLLAAVGRVVAGNMSYPNAQTAKDLDLVLQSWTGSDFFLKHSGGAHGHGAFTLQRHAQAYEFGNTRGNADELFAYIQANLPDGECYLLQPRIRNHPDLGSVMSPTGLGTVRVVSLLRAGDVSILSACLRITVGANVTDNFSVGSAGNLTAPIDLDTGRLGVAVGSRTKHWPDMHTVALHPDTGMAIEGAVVPEWTAVKALTLRAHKAFPELGVIGWDIAITEAGPLLVEANHAWDINLLQVAHREGFRSRMVAALGMF